MAPEAAASGFTPPPYPYDRLDDLREVADRFDGGCVDLSIGTPTDAPATAVVDALVGSGAERGYPASIGSVEFREAASSWMASQLGTEIPSEQIAACVGTKEFVAGLPAWLSLRAPDRDTVLYPEVSYPSYEMGATLAGCRAVPVPVNAAWELDLGAIDPADAARALCLWVNTPANPTGALDDLTAAASWGRKHDVLVVSDECYVEFTWDGPPRTILDSGASGLIALHSLSKRSNLAGARAGFYAGDPDLVRYLGEVRKHAGFMMPGPVQAAAAVALADQEHVESQRATYLARLERGRDLLASMDIEVELPRGGFYLWAESPDGDGWTLARRLAEQAGILASPGEFYGSAGSAYVRLAMVRSLDALEMVAMRLGL